MLGRGHFAFRPSQWHVVRDWGAQTALRGSVVNCWFANEGSGLKVRQPKSQRGKKASCLRFKKGNQSSHLQITQGNAPGFKRLSRVFVKGSGGVEPQRAHLWASVRSPSPQVLTRHITTGTWRCAWLGTGFSSQLGRIRAWLLIPWNSLTSRIPWGSVH